MKRMRRRDLNNKIDHSLHLADKRKMRKKNISEYFLHTSKYLRPWLSDLADKYMQRDIFPVMAISLLPSYYKRKEDKEVAAFLALFVNDNDNVLSCVSKFRKLLGKSPWKWFEQRKFVRLSLGKHQYKRTGGIENWKIAKLFDRLWDECHILSYDIPSEEVSENIVRPIGDEIALIAKEQRCSYYDVLTYLLEDCGVGKYSYKLRLFLQILACSNGFSLGLWSVDRRELKCPLTSDVKLFLQTWFPDYRRYGNVDDAIQLFGFERDCDFFYAYLGYKELQKRNPEGCSSFATIYQNWYDKGYYRKPYKWREIFPEIDFQ